MGGGAMSIDFPMIQFKTSSTFLPSPSRPSSSSSNLNFPVSSVHNTPPLIQRSSTTTTCCCCPGGTCTKLESLHGKDDERSSGSLSDVVFGAVPSRFEVETAMSALQNFLNKSGNWLLQALDCDDIRLDCDDIRALVSRGHRRVQEAFHLLLTDPSFKRLVVSLACDRAVWYAVMNNETLRRIRESSNLSSRTLELISDGVIDTVKDLRPQSSGEDPDGVANMLSWLMQIIKEKVTELIEKFQLFMNEFFQSLERRKPMEETTDAVDDKLRSSVLLSFIILLIVVVARLQGP